MLLSVYLFIYMVVFKMRFEGMSSFGYVLYALLALHIGAALKHQFIDREPELQRMSL